MASSIKYNGDVVNSTVSDINQLKDKFSSLSKTIKTATNKIVSARGFNEYIGGITSDTFSGYVEQCGSAVVELTNKIRQKQISILAYSGDKTDINAFLDTLDRNDYKALDLSEIEGEISFGRKAENVLKGIGGSIATFGIGLVEGVLDFGETGADLITLGGTLFASLFTKTYDVITDSDVTSKMWEETKAKVSEKKVESVFDSFYTNTKIGQAIKNNAYGYDITRGIGKGLGYTAGLIGVNIVTGGLASGAGIGAAGTIGAGQLAATAGVMGFSNGTEEAWADGASIEKGLTYGVASGAWEGLQWYAGAKINQYGGLGDKVSKGIFKGAASGVGTRIAMDTVDSGLEGFVQPALTMIYKDYGGANIVENYKMAFDQAGGWTNVASQAAMGGIASAFGEFSGARKLLKENKKADVHSSSGMEGIEGAGLLSAVAGEDQAARKIFETGGEEFSDAIRTIDEKGIRTDVDTKFNTISARGKTIPQDYRWFQDGSYLPPSTAKINSLDSSYRGIFKSFEDTLEPQEMLKLIEDNRANLSAQNYSNLKKATQIIANNHYKTNVNELKLILFHSEGNVGRIKSALAMSYANATEETLDRISNQLAKELFPIDLKSTSGLKKLVVDDFITAMRKNGADDWNSSNEILKNIDTDRLVQAASSESTEVLLGRVKNYFGGQLSEGTALKLANCDGYPNTIKKILMEDGTVPKELIDTLSNGTAAKVFARKNMARLKATTEVGFFNMKDALKLTTTEGASFKGYSDLLRATNLFSDGATRTAYYSIIDSLVDSGYSLKDATVQAKLMNGAAITSLGRTAPTIKVNDIFSTKDMLYNWDDSVFSSFDNSPTHHVLASDYMMKHYQAANGSIDTKAITRDFYYLMKSQYDNMDSLAAGKNVDTAYSKKAVELFTKSYVNAAQDSTNPNRGEALKFMSKILELKDKGVDIFVSCDGKSGSRQIRKMINLAVTTIDGNLKETVFHENGHWVFDNVLDSKFPTDYDQVRRNAVSKLYASGRTGKLDSYLNNLQEVDYYTAYLAKKELEDSVKRNGFSSMEDYRKALINKYLNTPVEDRSSRLKYATTTNGNIRAGSFDSQLGKMDFKKAEDCANIELNSAIRKIKDKIYRTEFEDYALVSSIIDSTTLGQKNLGYGHGQLYFERWNDSHRRSYHELIADYSNLKVSGNNKVIKYLRSVLGDELIDSLDNTYQQMLK